MHGRRWIPLPSARPADPTFTFTIMTWNILAQCLIKRELFPYILAKGKTSPLSAKHRIPIIIQHLYDLQPDIAALQEVDGDIWGDQIASRMKELGYDFVLTLKNPLKKVGHGLVVMWKIDKFRKREVREIQFDHHPLIHPTNIMPVTGNIAQLVALDAIDTKIPGFIVTNHHLYWRPTTCFTRLRQITALLEETRSFQTQLQGSWNWFCCGDYNVLPTEPTYQLLTSREPLTSSQRALLEPSDYELPVEPSSEPEQHTEPERHTVDTLTSLLHSHPVLHSAYKTYQTLDPDHGKALSAALWSGEPRFTNYSEFQGTLDYILTSFDGEEGSLRRVLSVPGCESVGVGLPNNEFPSDHLAIMAEYAIGIK